MAQNLQELVGFLHSDQPQIRQIALDHLVAYSIGDNGVWEIDGHRPIYDLAEILSNDVSNESAIKTAINLTGPYENRDKVSKIFILQNGLVDKLISSSDGGNYQSMLLSNLAKDTHNQELIWEVLNSKSHHLVNKYLNQQPSYEYLGYLISDLAQLEQQRRQILNNNKNEFTDLLNSSYRPAAASIIKNCCFESKFIQDNYSGKESNIIIPIISSILLGCDSDLLLNDKDSASLSPLLKNYNNTTQGKPKPEIQVATLQSLVESLILLTAISSMRLYMRNHSSIVYASIRVLHATLKEKAQQTLNTPSSPQFDLDLHGPLAKSCEQLVNILQRQDAPEMESKTLNALDPDDDDDDKMIRII